MGSCLSPVFLTTWFHACVPSQRDFCQFLSARDLLRMFCIVWTFRLIVKSISHRSIMFQSLLQICVWRSGSRYIVGKGMVTLSFCPGIFLVGEAALNISVDHFFRWKGKGSFIVPWSWGTPQWRENSRRIDAWLLTYNAPLFTVNLERIYPLQGILHSQRCDQ